MESIKTKHGLVNVCLDQTELGKAAAKHFVEKANQAIAERGQFTVALSGGHTPPLLYKQLSSGEFHNQVDWTKVHFFISDERCVPHDSKESNWGMAQRELLNKLALPKQNFHPTQDQDKNPAISAEDYEHSLREFFAVKGAEIPRFDLIQMGMGPDGHTASLFPGSKALTEQKRLVVDNFVDKFETYRITFTYPLINNAREIMFMLEGGEKSHVFAEVANSTTENYPVQRVAPTDGTVIWYVDQDVARDLKVNAK
jgi:6-phosphogluconolactonase